MKTTFVIVALAQGLLAAAAPADTEARAPAAAQAATLDTSITAKPEAINTSQSGLGVQAWCGGFTDAGCAYYCWVHNYDWYACGSSACYCA